jgi:3-methyladenine DNA glycosylase/8-oxoguanine DNA glycosylase
MRRLSNAQEADSEKNELNTRILKLEERVHEATKSLPSSPLDVLPPAKRGMYGQMIELIYECSTNRVAAKSLVDRILEKIALGDDASTGPSAKSLKKINDKARAPAKTTGAKKRNARAKARKVRRSA